MPHRLLGVLAPVAAAVAWLHLFGTYTGWVSPVHVVVAAIISAVALGVAWASWRGAGRVQHVLAATLLGAQLAITALTLAGVKLVAYDLFPDRRVALVGIACCGLTIYGLARRRVWGRWFGLALGATGAVTGGINAGHFWHVSTQVDAMNVAWSNQMFETAWVMLACAVGGLAIVVALVAPAARAACAADASWTSDTRLARLVRPMVVTAFAAVPMLLVYAWLQPIVAATQTTAIVLAAVLALATLLTVRGKLAGALLLVVAGLGMAAQTAATYAGAPAELRGIALYYVVCWAPAAVCAIVCGARLAGPTWRLLRGR